MEPLERGLTVDLSWNLINKMSKYFRHRQSFLVYDYIPRVRALNLAQFILQQMNQTELNKFDPNGSYETNRLQSFGNDESEKKSSDIMNLVQAS